MSKRNKEKSSEEEKNSDDCATVSRLHLSCFLSKSDDNQHVCRDSSKAGSTLKEGSLLSSEKPHSTATLCTRGPGRPRIHPLKPLGTSRPRGRPKGSRNKKPRKRLEKPPKRPRGRPRKWPPEMWEGFQRTKQAVLHQQLHDHSQPSQEIPSSTHFLMDQPEDVRNFLHPFSPGVSGQQHLHSSHLYSSPSRPHIPDYMQRPMEVNRSPRLEQLATIEINYPSLTPSVLLPDEAHYMQEDPSELPWIHHLPPENRHPPSTSC